jgi:hypothetical protein
MESSSNDNEGIVVQVFDSLPFSTLLNKTRWREEAMMVAPLAGTAREQINNADQKAESWNAVFKAERCMRSFQRPVLNRQARRRKGQTADQQPSDDEEGWTNSVSPLKADEFPVETTWHGVLVAERLRQMLLQEVQSSSSTLKQVESMVKANHDDDDARPSDDSKHSSFVHLSGNAQQFLWFPCQSAL